MDHRDYGDETDIGLGTPERDPVAAAIQHVHNAWEANITVGINPPGLLRAAVELADQRAPEANLLAAIYAAEAVRQLVAASNYRASLLRDARENATMAVCLSENLLSLAVRQYTKGAVPTT